MSRDLSHAVVLELQSEGGFTVTVPAWPEVVTQGETEAEALELAREAIELAMEVRNERSEPVPPPAETKIRHVRVAQAA